MAARTEQELIAHIREEGSTEALPNGWAIAPLRWHGRAMEVAFDSRHYQVMRAAPGPMDRDGRRHLFTEQGWHHVFTDGEGAELWIANHADLARGRLGRLRRTPSVGTEMTGPGIS